MAKDKTHIIMFISDDLEDDLSELKSEAVPDEVRKWLASTFAKQEQVSECLSESSRWYDDAVQDFDLKFKLAFN